MSDADAVAEIPNWGHRVGLHVVQSVRMFRYNSFWHQSGCRHVLLHRPIASASMDSPPVTAKREIS
jgi:hypothetical protein